LKRENKHRLKGRPFLSFITTLQTRAASVSYDLGWASGIHFQKTSPLYSYSILYLNLTLPVPEVTAILKEVDVYGSGTVARLV
jgi:hypothetical protein